MDLAQSPAAMGDGLWWNFKETEIPRYSRHDVRVTESIPWPQSVSTTFIFCSGLSSLLCLWMYVLFLPTAWQLF